jgi:hypothetical protein
MSLLGGKLGTSGGFLRARVMQKMRFDAEGCAAQRLTA